MAVKSTFLLGYEDLHLNFYENRYGIPYKQFKFVHCNRNRLNKAEHTLFHEQVKSGRRDFNSPPQVNSEYNQAKLNLLKCTKEHKLPLIYQIRKKGMKIVELWKGRTF